MVKVSVIVPVYNVEEYIDKCLDSLVNQTLKEIEIVIVNDGSKDNSEEIINKYIEKYSQIIKYVKKENGGLSDARNFGLKHATGEYIGFVDSDDYVSVSMFETMYKKAIDENADIVECNFEWVYPDYKKVDIGKKYESKTDMFIDSRVMMCNKIWKRELFENIQFPIGLRYEDVEVFFKILPKVKKHYYLDKVNYYYIQRDNSIANYQTEKTKDMFQILENIIEYYKENNIFDKYKDELEYTYIRFLLGSSLLRMLKIKKKEIRKRLLNENWNLLNKVFPNWKKNRILKTNKSKKNIYYKSINKFTYKIYCMVFRLKK